MILNKIRKEGVNLFLSITNTKAPASDMGYLLHKNPDGVQSFDIPSGRVHIFYPENSENRCTLALLTDIDPVTLVRGRSGSEESGPLEHYINDRPYTASSFLSVAITKVFSSALNGTCNKRPELVSKPLSLEIKIAVVPCRGGEAVLRRLFEPLGYEVQVQRHPLDEKFPEWGDSLYYTVELKCEKTVSEMLTHLYVLIPVLDDDKHYWVGDDEVKKLLSRGEGWLSSHPEKKLIVERYLKHRNYLAKEAFERLGDSEQTIGAGEEAFSKDEIAIESKISLRESRYAKIIELLKERDSRKVLEIGCGEGRFLKCLSEDSYFTEISGMDVSARSLEKASKRLEPGRFASAKKNRVLLFQGSLSYRDERLMGYDAIVLPEVIEHLDPFAFSAFEINVFGFAKPGIIILTTPNIEYNALFENLPANVLRHKDHRFEWTREQFREWAEKIAGENGYEVVFYGVGEEDPKLGSPTQLCVFIKIG
jgi:3' terminal RNA ribose 2'-O-methyltransferase Hen1